MPSVCPLSLECLDKVRVATWRIPTWLEAGTKSPLLQFLALYFISMETGPASLFMIITFSLKVF